MSLDGQCSQYAMYLLSREFQPFVLCAYLGSSRHPIVANTGSSSHVSRSDHPFRTSRLQFSPHFDWAATPSRIAINASVLLSEYIVQSISPFKLQGFNRRGRGTVCNICLATSLFVDRCRQPYTNAGLAPSASLTKDGGSTPTGNLTR